MATTVSLTKINFMSEDTFNKLSSLDSQQLYAVEASSLITSVMNNSNNYELVPLFESKASPLNTGDITLSQPFTNFPFIICVFSNDSGTNTLLHIYNTTILNWVLNKTFSKTETFAINQGNQGSWYIKNYANGSSTTLLKRSEENSSCYGIYGLRLRT